MSSWNEETQIETRTTYTIKAGNLKVTYYPEGGYAYFWTAGSNSITTYEVSSLEEATEWARSIIREMREDLDDLDKALKQGDAQ